MQDQVVTDSLDVVIQNRPVNSVQAIVVSLFDESLREIGFDLKEILWNGCDWTQLIVILRGLCKSVKKAARGNCGALCCCNKACCENGLLEHL